MNFSKIISPPPPPPPNHCELYRPKDGPLNLELKYVPCDIPKWTTQMSFQIIPLGPKRDTARGVVGFENTFTADA